LATPDELWSNRDARASGKEKRRAINDLDERQRPAPPPTGKMFRARRARKRGIRDLTGRAAVFPD
jgi:hypothetical protein